MAAMLILWWGWGWGEGFKKKCGLYWHTFSARLFSHSRPVKMWENLKLIEFPFLAVETGHRNVIKLHKYCIWMQGWIKSLRGPRPVFSVWPQSTEKCGGVWELYYLCNAKMPLWIKFILFIIDLNLKYTSTSVRNKKYTKLQGFYFA
jgi:hypothetical protein